MGSVRPCADYGGAYRREISLSGTKIETMIKAKKGGIFVSSLCLYLDRSVETQAGVAGTNDVVQT